MEDQSISFSLAIPTTATSASVHSLAPCIHSIDELFASTSPLHPHRVSGVAVSKQQQCAFVTTCQTLCSTHHSHYLMRDSEISTIVTFTLFF